MPDGGRESSAYVNAAATNGEIVLYWRIQRPSGGAEGADDLHASPSRIIHQERMDVTMQLGRVPPGSWLFT